MSKSSIFPYGINLREGVTVDIFPAAEIKIQSKEGEWLSVFFLIDSGAVLSALPRSDAPFLGIDVARGDVMYISGVSGQPIRGWRHSLNVRFGVNTINLPFVFLDNQNAPRVLGRAGLFEKFSIIFEEANKRSGFLERGSREADAVSKVLSRIG